jgi:hypothetical protein
MMKKPKKGLLWLSNLIACIVLILSGPVLAASADNYEDDNTFDKAALINTNEIKDDHTIHSSTDEDWFQFKAVKGHRYQIIAEPGADLDIVIELYDTTGKRRLERKNREFEGEEEKIDFTPTTDGSYYVRITHTGFFGLDTKYQIQITEKTPPTAIISAVPETGEAPLVVTLNGSSSDGRPVTCEWEAAGKDNVIGCNVKMTFDTLGIHTITLTVTDNDGLSGTEKHDVNVTPKLVIEGIDLLDDGETNKKISVLEDADSKTFTVKLLPAPTQDVPITITPQANKDQDITLTPDRFTLTSHNSEQLITLTAAKDEDIENGSAVFTVTAQGVERTVEIAVTEEEPLQLVVVENPIQGATTQTAIDAAMMNTISVSEGNQILFTVQVLPKPSQDVPVTIKPNTDAGNDQDITLTPDSSNFILTSPNYQKVITLQAAPDADFDNGTAVFTVTATVAGVDKIVDITVHEEESPQLLLIDPITKNPITEVIVPEGNQTPFTVQVLPKPSQDVQVTIMPKAAANNDPDITLQTGDNNFILTSTHSTKEVTVIAAADEDIDNGTAVFSVTATVEGVDKTVDITVHEEEPLQLVVDATEVFVPEGDQAQFNVNLSKPPSQDVEVTITTGNDLIDSGSDLSLTPTGLFNFVSGENTAKTLSLTAKKNAATKHKPKTILTLSAQNIEGGSKQVKVFVLPSLGMGTAFNLDQAIPSPTTITSFSGGVSVNDGAFEKEPNINQGETFSIKGLIKVDSADVGKQANFLTAISYEFDPTIFDNNSKPGCYSDNPTTGWYLFITETAFYDCGEDIGGLLGKAITDNAFTKSVALSEIKPLLILSSPSLPSNSKLTVFFGYRLIDGTIVHSSQPIIVNVSD